MDVQLYPALPGMPPEALLVDVTVAIGPGPSAVVGFTVRDLVTLDMVGMACGPPCQLAQLDMITARTLRAAVDAALEMLEMPPFP